MSEILFFADSHAQRGAWANLPIFGDADYALAQILAIVERRRPIAVIGGGDLIDRQVNRSAPPAALQTFARALRELGVPFYFIQGQHDRDDPPWLANFAEHLNERLVGLGRWRLYGLDFQPRDALPGALAEIPEGADVLVAHQVWSPWMGEMGGQTNPEGDLHAVPVVQAIWSGDLHDYRVTQLARGSLALSPGATCKQAIDEPDFHYVIAADANMSANDPRAYTRISLRSRPVIRPTPVIEAADVEAWAAHLSALVRDATAAAASQHLPSELHAPLIRLQYAPEFADLPARLRRQLDALGLKAHIFPKRLPAAAAVAAVAAPEGFTQFQPKALVPGLLPADASVDAVALCDVLLDAGEDWSPALDQWCERYLQAEAA